jgi:hypothetical protein
VLDQPVVPTYSPSDPAPAPLGGAIAVTPTRDPIIAHCSGHDPCPDSVDGHVAEGADITYDIPWKVANYVAKYGLSQHLPLTYLTDKALNGTVQAGDGDEVINLDRDSLTLRTSTKPFCEDGEDALSYMEWKQAYKRYLLIIAKYLPKDYDKWLRHMLAIEDTLHAIGSDWKLWLLYDIEVRKRATFVPLDPSVFQTGIFQRIQSRWLIDKVSLEARAEARSAALRAVSSSSASPASSTQSKRPGSSLSGSGSSGTVAKSGHGKPQMRSFCLCCGRIEHRTDECTDTTRVDGGALFIKGKAIAGRSAYRDPSGKPVCLRWNARSACKPRSGEPCSYQHICTLDGKDHRASDCPLVADNRPDA